MNKNQYIITTNTGFYVAYSKAKRRCRLVRNIQFSTKFPSVEEAKEMMKKHNFKPPYSYVVSYQQRLALERRLIISRVLDI